jgi:hypothetical protein
MVGITASETARLNVVALADPTSQAGCQVALAFLSAGGRVLKQDVRIIQPGNAISFDLPGGEASLPPGPIALRTAIRPVAHLTTDTCRMVPSFELFDNATGRTSIFASHPPSSNATFDLNVQ